MLQWVTVLGLGSIPGTHLLAGETYSSKLSLDLHTCTVSSPPNPLQMDKIKYKLSFSTLPPLGNGLEDLMEGS